VSNPAALDWFLARLRALQDSTGLDGFKFDAGEAIFLPRDAVTHTPAHPNDYPHRYVNFVANHFSLCEVRAGWQNQSAPIFFRQWDKTTGWGLDNGLHSVLTGILSLALTGYPFVLPDMIGGNAYNESPDAELMIRWTQLNALLPAMQFSLAPWDYGGECDELCRRYADLHTEVAPLILRLAGAAARTGEPIIRPAFWLAPHDERALRCDDEFLVGDEALVAPVVQPGARSRPIYFPPGRWRDHWSGRLVEGPATVDSYPAPLDRLPLFQRD
jgi:alpha-glucosidase (family GH31 glycosyl hydrolase)